ncbi:hypothetical protein ACRAQ7_00825 [Erythrobacter sp. W53]|uniref:hypothetical protein n=1 Tax=Erythrobacter sp. W53 TaxID=3425947 RepID=UPI003D76880D
MKRTKQMLGTVSAVALVGFTSAPAIAAGTTAGDTITNNVSVSYDVGGVTQTPETASDTFTVDRIINLTVQEVGGAATSVAPNETNAVTVFEVTNTSNDEVDFALSLTQSGADDFDITNVRFFLDDGGTPGAFDGTNTLVTSLDDVAEDATVTVLVVGDIPLGVTDGQTADVTLVADATDDGGTPLTNTAGANTAGIDTVLADDDNADIAGDDSSDGDDADTDTYVVSAAAVTVAKSSTVIADPVNGTTNPKAVPGAIVEYCIVVSNASGATATGIVINDDFTSEAARLDFVPGGTDPNAYAGANDIFVDGDGSCAGGTGVDTGATAATTVVSNGLSDVAAGQARSLRFRVIIE